MQKDLFLNRHIGPNPEAEQHMLNGLGISSTEQLIDETVPESIRLSQPLNVQRPSLSKNNSKEYPRFGR